MNTGKCIFLVIFKILSVYSYDSCSEQVAPDECNKYRTTNFNENDCSQINFSGYKPQKNDLGDIKLTADTTPTNFSLNITFVDVTWNKAYLKLSENDVGSAIICKMYSSINKICVPNKPFFTDSCFNPRTYELKDYLLEYKVETDKTVAYKKVLFKPLQNYNIHKMAIFSYIDITNSFEIILHIQALPEDMNISSYKVEVFKEKMGKGDIEGDLLDIRLIRPNGSNQYTFNFITYNEEGYYYFKISIISEYCPEDFCQSTVTPKVHISRRGTPLVIGIVGASFIIPFVLFVFHMMTRRYQNQEEILESKDKILVIYKAHPDAHKDVILALANLIEKLTTTEVLLEPVNLIRSKQKEPERWCSDSLLLATHIFYICGPDDYKMDYMTYSYLVEETRKPVQDKDIFVLKFPYSSEEFPSFLSKCLVFDLPEDTDKLLKTFKNDLQENENNTEYSEFYNKIKKLQTNIRTVRIPLNMPTIIITEQSDNETGSDGNAKDSLL